MENKIFPKAMQFYHQYPIRTKSGDIFTEPGMINYTIELRDADGNRHYKEVFFQSHITFLAKTKIFQKDLIISDLRAWQVPYQNPKLSFLHVGDVEISSLCYSEALHSVGFISTTCPELDKNMIQVSKSSLSHPHRPVSNWIRQKKRKKRNNKIQCGNRFRKHIGSLDIELVNNKIIVKDWGSLVHLGGSPCKEETMGITFHYMKKHTGVKIQTDTKVK